MKKFIIKVFAVIVAAVVVYLSFIIIFLSIGKVNKLPNIRYTLGGYGYTLLRLEEAKTVKDVNILFVGSSHVYRAFDTRIFEKNGYSSFNYGTSSQPPYVTYYLLRDFLKHSKPKHVVLDLYWSTLQESSIEAGVDIVSNSVINRTVIDLVRDSDDIILYNALLISGFRQIFKPISARDQKHYEKDLYIPNGFVESTVKQNKLSPDKLAGLIKYDFQPAEIQISSIEKIIKLCKENDIKLTFVVTPVTREYLTTVKNYDVYTELITNIASKHSITLIDYNLRGDLDLNSQTDFFDKNHLNQTGVIKFNELFIQDFKNIERTNLAVN